MFKKKAFIYFFFVISTCSYIFANDRQSVIQTIEKITNAHHQLSLEVSNWNAEKETLKNELAILKASVKDFSDNEESLQKKIDELKKKKAELEAVLAKQEKLMKNIGNFISKNSKFLFSACSKIPESLKYLIDNDESRLRSQLVDNSSSNGDKLSSINALTSSLVKAQKEIHVVKEIVTLNSNSQEVDALYLGTYTGFFRNSQSKTYGKLILKNGKWTTVEDSSLAEEIEKLFDQFNKKGAPQIIQLPIGGNQ